MKAIIPAAGKGTRLYPQTHTKPKAMVRLAGKPILGHILSALAETEVDEAIIVVGGPMKDQIVEYTQREFGDRFDFHYPVQENALGLGHSVQQAEPHVGGEPVIIALGDMLFERGYDSFLKRFRSMSAVDGALGVKRVDEPEHYGVVDLEDQQIVRLVEKPDNPPSDWAISGVYLIDNSELLFDCLEYLLDENLRGAGDEYQLTDALQEMVERGADLGVFEVEDWYDCGRPETLLEANRVLLSKYQTNSDGDIDSAVLIPPVDIGKDVTVSKSIIGPHVSIDDGSSLENSIVEDSIIGQNADLTDLNISESILGDSADISGQAKHLNVGDDSNLTI